MKGVEGCGKLEDTVAVPPTVYHSKRNLETGGEAMSLKHDHCPLPAEQEAQANRQVSQRIQQRVRPTDVAKGRKGPGPF